jgi:FkbM family methyltransferase
MGSNMIFEFDEFIKKPIKGIIQVGAHFGQEYEYYSKFTKNILMFEPQPNVFKELKNRMHDKQNVVLENLGCGEETSTVTMFVEQANQGQSSSVLQPALHTLQYPGIVFTDVIPINIVSLNDYFKEKENTYNMLSIDVQGYELQVLKGASNILNNIDYIYCEVNFAEMYKQCALVKDIDMYLKQFGLIRIKTVAATETWGDALYIRE